MNAELYALAELAAQLTATDEQHETEHWMEQHTS